MSAMGGVQGAGQIVESAKAALRQLEAHPSRDLSPSGHAEREALKTVLQNQIKIGEALQSLAAGIDSGLA